MPTHTFLVASRLAIIFMGSNMARVANALYVCPEYTRLEGVLSSGGNCARAEGCVSMDMYLRPLMGATRRKRMQQFLTAQNLLHY